MTAESPYFTLVVPPDKMKAVLLLKYHEEFYSHPIEYIYKQILSFLNQNGVLVAIQKNMILQAVSQVQAEQKNSAAFTCAVGRPAVDGKPYQYKFYADMQQENLQKWLRTGSSYTVIKSEHPVKAKDVILEILPGERGTAGFNVLGETLAPQLYPVIKLEAGLNVKDYNHQQYTALVSGIVQIERNFISVLPFEEMKLKLEISQDRMQAFLYAVKSGQKILPPQKKSVDKFLSRYKIRAGIISENIDAFLEAAGNEAYTGEKFLIAQGAEPVNGTEASFMFYFPVDPSLIDFPPSAVRWDDSRDNLFHRDQPVGEKIPACEEEAGYTVFGEVLKPEKKKDWKLTLEKKLIAKEDKEQKKIIYYASVGGHVHLKGKTLFLDPYEDASFQLKIQDDFSRAYIDLFPARGGGRKLLPESVFSELRLENIVYGVKEEVLKEAVEKVNNNNEIIKNLLIAEGVPAQNGKDGTIRIFFETGSSLVAGDEIRINFKEREAIPYIEKDKVMAEIIPPTQGINGKDIQGKDIQAQDGAAVQLKVGDNAEWRDNKIFAKISGWPVYRNNMINVLPYYETEGDVGYGTGNISFYGTVMVKGDVQTGFHVNAAKGDLIIAGNCHQGILKSSGNIIVKGGVIKSVVEANNDFTAKFAEYSRINAKGDVHILASSLNNVIMSGRNVYVNKGKGVILGGKTFAQQTIQCLVSGNDAQVETYLFAGEEFFSKAKLQKIKKHITELLEEKNNLELFLQEKGEDKAVTRKISLLSHQIRRLYLIEQSLTDKIQKVHQEQDSFIYIKSDVFSGTIITVKENSLKIKTDTKNMFFQFDFSRNAVDMRQNVKELPDIADCCSESDPKN